MDQLTIELINLAGYELNAALRYSRYHPAEARKLVEEIKAEEVALVAENNF